MICDSFKRLSLDTWDLLRKCVAYNHQFGEESVTDINLLKIKEWEPDVITHQFTRRGERKSGADWEWWFEDSSGVWIGIRIQAKIINLTTQGFHHLHYPIQIEKKLPGHTIAEIIQTSQTEILIASSKSAEKTVYPLYCLYCYWDSEDIKVSSSCTGFQLFKHFFGCSIIDAHKVLELNDNGLHQLDEISEFLRPLHCLVCCPGNPRGGNGNFVNGINTFLKNILNFPHADKPNYPGFDNLIHDSPPSYVNNVLKFQKKHISEGDNIYSKDESLGGVIIFRSKQ